VTFWRRSRDRDWDGDLRALTDYRQTRIEYLLALARLPLEGRMIMLPYDAGFTIPDAL
jgi:hypothetical protein